MSATHSLSEYAGDGAIMNGGSSEGVEQVLSCTKGVVEGIFRALGVKVSVIASSDPLLHPGMQGDLKVGRTTVGRMGVIHPLLQEKCQLSAPLVYVELDVAVLAEIRRDISYPKVSSFPFGGAILLSNSQ